jgi:hypothetical protein
MQDLKDKTQICANFPATRPGQRRVELEKFKPIRRPQPSDGSRRQAAFAVHY